MTEDEYLDLFSDLYEEKWGSDWTRAVVGTAAEEIRRRRVELSLSQYELADACKEIGYPIPRNVLANLESGRRESLQVVELLVLAKALECSPVTILFPVGYRESVHPLPGSPHDSLAAADWVSDVLNTDSDLENSYQLPLYRDHARTRKAREGIRRTVQQTEADLRHETGMEKRQELRALLSEAQAEVAKANARLAEIEAHLEEDGLRLPVEPV